MDFLARNLLIEYVTLKMKGEDCPYIKFKGERCMGGIKTNLDNIHLLALENYKNKVDKSKKGRGRHRDSWLTYSIEEFLLLHQKGATNRELSEIYGISIRYVQYIMKEVGLASKTTL